MLFIPSFTKISLPISLYNIHVSILTRGRKKNHTHAAGSIFPEKGLSGSLQRVILNSISNFKVIFNQKETAYGYTDISTHVFQLLSFNCARNYIFCTCARTGSDQKTRNYRLQQVITSNYLSWRLFLVTDTAHSNFLMKCQIHCNKTKCRHDQHTQETGYDNDEAQ
jgi:hypothetical protein